MSFDLIGWALDEPAASRTWKTGLDHAANNYPHDHGSEEDCSQCGAMATAVVELRRRRRESRR